MRSLEECIAYKFRNSLLLAEALTHPSLAYETHKPHFDNQRLEFLGDAVIQLILTDELFHRFPDFNEGNLTKLRSRLVSRAALSRYAAVIDLGSYLMMGKGEEASGGRTRASTLADGFEALLGAVYLDSGKSLTEPCAILLNLCRSEIASGGRQPDDQNPKGQLQEILQAFSAHSPSYSITAQEGPDHCKTFESIVLWQSLTLGKGSGPSKKEAEIEAARIALESEILQQLSSGIPIEELEILQESTEYI